MQNMFLSGETKRKDRSAGAVIPFPARQAAAGRRSVERAVHREQTCPREKAVAAPGESVQHALRTRDAYFEDGPATGEKLPRAAGGVVKIAT